MSSTSLWEVFGVILQIVVLLVVISFSAGLITRRKNVLLTVFFTFSLVSWLLSDFYWITYDLLRPGTRMPLAANELGECALSLLMAAGLSPYIKKEPSRPRWEAVYAILFTVANTALWIVWSGEWLQDIVCGLALCVFTSVVAIILIQTETIPRVVRVLLVLSSVLVLVFQTACTYIKTPLTKVLEYSSYVLMYAFLAYFIIKAFILHRSGARTKPFVLMTAAFCWAEFNLYMSPGWIYSVSLMVFTVTIPFMYLTLRREVYADDIC